MLYRELNDESRKELRDYFEDRDYMVIAVPRHEPIRMYVVRANRTVETARRVHNLAPPEALLLGEALLAALLLSSLVKHATDQKVLFKLNLEEGSVVAEADGKGRVRGFIEGQVTGYWKGDLTVIKELRLGVPYTSIVPVVGNSVKDTLQYYFHQSEQIKTVVDMAVKLDDEGRVRFAGAYMVQMMGGTSPKAEELMEKRLKELPPLEKFLEEGKRPEDIATEVLGDMEPRLVGLKEVEYYCPCTEDIAKASLLLLSEEELNEVLQQGPAEVVCKFCGRIYRFTREELML